MLPDAVGERTGGAANVGATARTREFVDSAARLGLSPPVFQGALGNSSALPQNEGVTSWVNTTDSGF